MILLVNYYITGRFITLPVDYYITGRFITLPVDYYITGCNKRSSLQVLGLSYALVVDMKEKQSVAVYVCNQV